MKKTLLMAILVLLSALVTQAATKYDINVAGVEVTSDNMNNIKGGDIKSGTVTFSPSTKTLTMTNVTITRTGSGDYGIHNRSFKGLIVRFVGTCNLTAKARVIRFECGENWSNTETPLADECQLVASSGATVNLTSTGDGAIYVRDFTAVWIKGPGTFNITGNKDGAIAGHGSWNSSMTDLATTDAVKFSNVTATVTGAQSCLLGLAAHFYAGCNVTLKATNNSSYPIARELYAMTKFFGKTAVVSPAGATFDSSSSSFVANGSKIYDKDILITDNYVAIINSNNFTDPDFRAWMLRAYPKGYITQSDVDSRNTIYCNGNNIYNLKGIEYFNKLVYLYCYDNKLTRLPSLPSTLNTLECYNNQLTDLPTLPANLMYLRAANNAFTSLTLYGGGKLLILNLDNNKNMTKLDCSNTAVTNISISGCSALTSLSCRNNQITSLPTLPSTLTYLDCRNNQIATLPTLPSTLTYLDCENNQITSLPTLPSGIESIFAQNNKLTSVNTLDRGKLKTLDLRYNSSLTSLVVSRNSALTTLSLSGCSALTSLSMQSLSSFNFAGFSVPSIVTYWDCGFNNLTSLPSLPAALKTLCCYHNKLTSLPTLPSGLERLECNDNQFTTLTVTNLKSLVSLRAEDNPKLTTLNCSGNALTSLNVSNNTALTTLSCQLNQLSSLTNLPSSLTTLNCCYNNLSSLSASGLTALSSLQINNNKIKAAAMGNLINSLRTIPAGSNGYLYVLGLNSNTYNIPEGNEITNEQLTAAQAKRWIPMKFENGNWVDIPMPSGGMRGDVNGDGKCDVEDVNAAINITIKLKTAADYPGNADLNNDGKIDVEDVNAIINITLKL